MTIAKDRLIGVGAAIPESEPTQVRFEPGTVIYPYGSNIGWTISTKAGKDLAAQETTQKRGKLKVFVVTSQVVIYRDGKYLTLVEGKQFAAYSSKAKRIKSNSNNR